MIMGAVLMSQVITRRLTGYTSLGCSRTMDDRQVLPFSCPAAHDGRLSLILCGALSLIRFICICASALLPVHDLLRRHEQSTCSIYVCTRHWTVILRVSHLWQSSKTPTPRSLLSFSGITAKPLTAGWQPNGSWTYPYGLSGDTYNDCTCGYGICRGLDTRLGVVHGALARCLYS